MAFPLTDQTNPSVVPGNNDLTTPDLEDLQRQMGLASGFASFGSAQGWTILPRLTMEEEFTDNILEEQSPRRWDLTTIFAPGVIVLGNSDRAQLRLNYQPTLQMHLINGSQNVLAQQLNAVGTLTVVPDLFFVDVRGLAGVQATNGGIGGLGGLGQPGIGGITGNTITPDQAGNLGLAKQNLTQTASASVSPYILTEIGDVGTLRLGVSLNQSTSSSVSGFAPIPLVSQGPNEAHITTTGQNAQFQTGDEFTVLRDTFTANGTQSTSGGTGFSTSSRYTASDRLDYQVTRSIDLYGQIGYEDIKYSGTDALAINGLTWGFGTVLTPNPDTMVSIGYGRQNGIDSLTASAYYALTARTILNASYNNGVGTLLEQVSSQLDQASVGNNGNLVNSQTGAPLFTGNNALGVTTGVYRYSYLTLGGTTTLDRDIFTLRFGRSQETSVGASATGSTNSVTTGTLSWTHELSPDLIGSTTASYSLGSPTLGSTTRSLVGMVSLQYILSDTLSTFARYTFYDVQSDTAGQSWYQDLFLVGFTKQF